MKIFEISIFGLTIAPTYYGLMYILGFIYGIWALKKTGRYSDSQRESIFIYIFVGVILGGRLGYILFYNFSNYLSHPLDIFKVWEGGMSFHGGMLGVGVALYLFSRKYKLSLATLTDDIALIIPVGLFFGRIGNYLNKELLGFEYSGPLAVITSQGSFFPSPLIEALLEGLVMFIILHFIAKKQEFPGQTASLFLIFYGIFRSFVELFIRTPDPQIGYYFGFITQGSILSFLMVIGGVITYISLKQKNATK